MTKEEKEEQEFLTAIGARIRELRKKKGYDSYEPFSWDHGLPRAQIGRYEKGENMKILSLYKVLKALEVTPKEFFKVIDK